MDCPTDHPETLGLDVTIEAGNLTTAVGVANETTLLAQTEANATLEAVTYTKNRTSTVEVFDWVPDVIIASNNSSQYTK